MKVIFFWVTGWDNVIMNFTDKLSLLNVAISRAKGKLCVVV